jgi:hypothetical protein
VSRESRIKKLESLTVKEDKGIKYDFSALTTEELKYMLTIPTEQWEEDTKCIELFSKVKEI